ncbi:hypothetical protein Nham_2713 [Nitrobacter hamburgensis X14]|uniref:Uncharacterized protein n=1 Tax=Nitrobacter hamburgensis (strain DSM 10229 / NCIMB 13809 / X14) TaxID=323097 RepID=Q1QJV5_NITHX|nr:hypothetical protein Nham_2713 [Nitrobacter hamburgensis X14]
MLLPHAVDDIGRHAGMYRPKEWTRRRAVLHSDRVHLVDIGHGAVTLGEIADAVHRRTSPSMEYKLSNTISFGRLGSAAARSCSNAPRRYGAAFSLTVWAWCLGWKRRKRPAGTCELQLAI